MTAITVSDPSLVLLVGAKGSGKSTLAARLFHPTEVVNLDRCRALVSGSEDDQSATPDAVAVASEIVERRLRRRLLTVIDATNVRAEDRARWTDIAARTHSMTYTVILDPGQAACRRHAKARDGEDFQGAAIDEHHRLLARDRRKLSKRRLHVLDSEEEIAAATLVRKPTWNDRRDVTGALDIVGDIHGMTDELEALLEKLGWSLAWDGEGEARRAVLSHPEGRRLVFVGDAVDRGPRSRDALLVMKGAIDCGVGHAVVGNHDDRFRRWLQGKQTSGEGGIETTIAEFEGASPEYRAGIAKFLDDLPAHLVFDGGRLAVAHAGLEEAMVLGASPDMREFAVFGPKTPPDAEGKSARVDWAKDYKGKTAIVYGHVASQEAVWYHNTICIDTGCVFGGPLTALRWPEKELVSVPASRLVRDMGKPMFTRRDTRDASVVDISDITGKRHISTRLRGRVTVESDQMASALEALSRFTVDPRVLIHLPPTMSPVASSKEGAFLEHPHQAFEYYLGHGVSDLVMETKHMGSRAVILVCRDAAAMAARFGTDDGHVGQVWSRTGKAFFPEAERREVTERLAAAYAPLFDRLESDWLLLDAEIMPWNAKATGLIKAQYAPTGGAAMIGTAFALDALERYAARGVGPVGALAGHFAERHANAVGFDAAWRGYCWDSFLMSHLKIAPFHVLASEGRVHTGERHVTHLEWIGLGLGRDTLLAETDALSLDVSKQSDVERAVTRWLEATSAGAEGVVVKPGIFTMPVEKGVIQPALKVRGREYLRIIYGPDYDMPENLDRLRERNIENKRAKAIREYALGIEAMERFVRREPLRRVHECVAAILGLETDATDPRL